MVLVLVGIAFCSWAGKLRHTQRNAHQGKHKSSFAMGLIICIASGLLSSSGNLGFAFGREVIQRAVEHGAAVSMAGNSLWAFITMPVFLVNATYCCWLLKTRRTGSRFFEPGTQLNWVLAMSMGLAANIAGFFTGEWKGASRKAYVFLLGGTITLLVAISVVGYANHL
jgi:hypothetical protein